MIEDLVRRNRSYRRFVQREKVELGLLLRWVDLGRLAPSARNQQPLKYMISNDPSVNGKIFPHIAWAGALKDWPGPFEGERPSAYVAVLHDTGIPEADDMMWCDVGLACQNILLGAVEDGYGGCLIGAFNKDQVAGVLGIGLRYRPLLLIALGKPLENVTLEPLVKDGDITYYRDQRGTHHVPKRSMEELVVRVFSDAKPGTP